MGKNYRQRKIESNIATFKPIRTPGESLKKIEHYIKRQTLKGDYCNLGCCYPGSSPSKHPYTKGKHTHTQEKV